ncbi:MAG: hypothetical protein JRC87_02780 [Deltaproteobacteria bacterium]|nr:hypothetical protein [Deltaproteobacteria bacterium]MBW2658513.1 hypothetical protein [Deltaproteobacteria bacterium]
MFRPVHHFRRLTTIAILCAVTGLSSCASLISSTFVDPAVENLKQQTDLELVCEGAPAYLLMIDSMIASSPENKKLLRTGSQSYSAYSAALSECTGTDERISAITEKAHLYGIRLLSRFLPMDTMNGEEFDEQLAKLNKNDVPFVFWGTFGWISWVQAQRGSPAAMADLVPIEKIMSRLLELDDGYEGGSIHLFFGGYYAAKPVLFGGKPGLSKIHFEKALNLSKRRFLLIQTTYAATLARQLQNRELHDQLLQEVLSFPLDSAPEFALSNRIAVKRARRLLADDYFAE